MGYHCRQDIDCFLPPAYSAPQALQTFLIRIDCVPPSVHLGMLFHHPLPMQAIEYPLGWTGGQGSLLHAYDLANVELRERL